ncbi:MAG: hydrogenase [candidate division FCPU426 bacterium]
MSWQPEVANLLSVLLILSGLALFGASRLAFGIRVVAVQGLGLGLLPVFAGAAGAHPSAWIMSGAAILLKAVVFPWLLLRAMRQAEVRHEVEPFVGFGLSIWIGIVLLAACVFASRSMAAWPGAPAGLPLPASFFLVLTGFFLITTRLKALTQTIGYLVLENGVFAFGTLLVPEAPRLLELAVLLDVLAAVFIMGIAIFHIHRKFDHIDTNRMNFLRDWRREENRPGARIAPEARP